MRLKVLKPLIAAIGACLLVAACGKDTMEDTAPGTAETGKAASEAPALARTPSPAGAEVFFITPADGDTVSNPVTIEFGIRGMSVVKAGVDEPASGHHQRGSPRMKQRE